MFKRNKDKLIKKLSGHELFFNDEEFSNYKFYARLNDMYDISVLVFHPEDLTYREFIVDIATLLAIYEFAEDENFTAHKRFIKPGARPGAVRPLLEKGGYTLLKTGDSKIIKSFIVAKMTEHTVGTTPVKNLDIKRIVTKPSEGSPLVGVDTLVMPHYVAERFMVFVRKLFKNVDIEIDLEEAING